MLDFLSVPGLLLKYVSCNMESMYKGIFNEIEVDKNR